MNKRIALTAAALITVFASGCSIFPYEENFSCEGKADYGKCVSMREAYNEAITGEPAGKKIKRGEPLSAEDEDHSASSQNKSEKEEATRKNVSNPRAAYKEALYEKLENMLTQPVTPIIKNADVARVLIVSYPSKMKGRPLFMPRHVYFFIEDPQWVMGEYLDSDREPLRRMFGEDKKRVND